MLKDVMHVDETGVTLVELIVGMILLVVVGGMVTKMVIDGTNSTNKTIAADRIMQYVEKAEQTMDTDLRSIQAKHRTTAWLRTPSDVRVAILYQRPAFGYQNNGQKVRLDVHDIAVANSQRFVFQSNTFGETSNPECVEYRSEFNASHTKWHFKRLVHRYSPGCSNLGPDSSALDSSMLIPNIPVEQLVNFSPNILSYGRTYNPTKEADPRAFKGVTMPDLTPRCHSPKQSYSKVTGQRYLDQITSVSIDARNLVANSGTGVSDQDLRYTLAIRTRQQYDYMYALGCLQ